MKQFPDVVDLYVKKNFLAEVVKNNALKFGDFKLSSGEQSNYFIDCSKLWNSECLFLIAEYILNIIKPTLSQACGFQVGGPSIGVDPIVGALLTLARSKGYNLYGFLMRKDGNIEGICCPISTLIIDDVATTGKQLHKTISC